MRKKIAAAAVGITCVIVMLATFFYNPTEDNKILNETEEWKIFRTESGKDGIFVSIVGENYMQKEGTLVRADSEESEATAVSMLTDGICDDKRLRWSSDNDWEDNEHWVEVVFSEPLSVGCIRLYWERLNALQYAIEVSQDGKEWTAVAAFTELAKEKCQDIVLEEGIMAQYLRLHILDVNKAEEDGSLYYQNVSLLEMEVYGTYKDNFFVKVPVIGDGNGRILETPVVPDGYELEFAGADYENIIDENGNIADTLSEVRAEIGYRLCKDGREEELPALQVIIPGSVAAEEDLLLPDGFEPMEWLAAKGEYFVSDDYKIFVEDEARLRKSAEIFAKELETRTGTLPEVFVVNADKEVEKNGKKGDFYLKYSPEITAEEGYRLSLGTQIEDMTVIEGKTLQGIRWGCVSVLELLESSSVLKKGTIYDYPRYEVRGFGIDVGRRAIPMTMLYRMVEDMSAQKMNTLLVHLNDNQIIAQSEHGGTVDGVRNLYSAFRLESDIVGEQGIGLTSTDLYYSKAEFAEFVEFAALYGVEVVPEIDTPGHSLALIKVFPGIGSTDDVYTADQLVVSKEETREVVKSIWREYLEADGENKSVFAECNTVHIGMDEYLGDGDAFMSYLKEISSYIGELAPDKKIRMWGSLSGMDSDYADISREIELQLWSTKWADPGEMYEAGFSIINSQKNYLYIIPGGGYDRLDVQYLETEWEPNVFINEKNTWEIPIYSDQMLGACYMMWNDMIMMDGLSISEEDLYDRFYEPLEVIADKLWN